ncbi:MAG: peptidase M22 [Clostridia bacterium]|nr:peptidase M22 [Clostridia bacterium]
MYLGIDTSNYTSSCAVYDEENDIFYSKKQLLPVADGQLGLRQSDAVFHHTKNLPPLLAELCSQFADNITAVGASYAPRDVSGSYMPCFSVGEGYANVISATLNVNRYAFSHQAGHIAAALWSSGQHQLVNERFIAFHVSGGTTDVLLVEPDDADIFRIEMLASSLDLKAGQAVDRVGVMLGLPFPAGVELDKLSLRSEKEYKIQPFMRDGSCSFSGVENKCRQMLDAGESKEDIAKYCISYICTAVKKMTESALKRAGDIPVLYAGGVMSNTIINKTLSNEFGGFFAEPYYSSDNAAGTAYLTYLKEKRK